MDDEAFFDFYYSLPIDDQLCDDADAAQANEELELHQIANDSDWWNFGKHQ